MRIFTIGLSNFTVFVPPKAGCKYSYTNSYVCAVTAITQDDHRSQLELASPVLVLGRDEYFVNYFRPLFIVFGSLWFV